MATSALDRDPVPRWIVVIGAWSWRVLLGLALAYVAVLVTAQLLVIFVPIVVALFIASVLEPVAGWLRRSGLPSTLATWLVFLAFLVSVVVRRGG